MYQICLTNETPVSQFKESDVVLARLQQAQWQQNMSLHCWCLHQESHINKRPQNQNSEISQSECTKTAGSCGNG